MVVAAAPPSIRRLPWGPPQAAAAAAAEAAHAAEEAELRARAEALPPLPTSLNQYKKHPQFVLERDIGRHAMAPSP